MFCLGWLDTGRGYSYLFEYLGVWMGVLALDYLASESLAGLVVNDLFSLYQMAGSNGGLVMTND